MSKGERHGRWEITTKSLRGKIRGEQRSSLSEGMCTSSLLVLQVFIWELVITTFVELQGEETVL